MYTRVTYLLEKALKLERTFMGLAGCGMGDEIILSGPGYVVFHGRDAGCFEIDGGIEDHKNHFITEKKNTEQ